MLLGCNPYDTSQLEQQYFLAGGNPAQRPRWYDTPPVYPPSAFLTLSPLALLRFPVAQRIWFLMNGCLFMISSLLILSMCPRSHRWLATILVSLILVSGEFSLALGNPAIFAISLLAISIYFFLRGRFLLPGALLLMFSLAVKPQIGGLIVLYLLVKGIHRRYALVAAAGALALLISAGLILSMHRSSAGWTSDLHTSISTSLSPGHINDFGPANMQATTLVNLQTVLIVFITDASAYNIVAYAIFLALLAVWITAVLRTKASPEITFLLIAALSVLSLTPIYHHVTDCGILLLTIPAVIIVYQKRRLLGALIGILTVSTVFILQFWVQRAFVHLDLLQSVLHNKILFVLLLRQQNLELPILFCLYMVAIFTIRFDGAPANVESTALSLDTA